MTITMVDEQDNLESIIDDEIELEVTPEDLLEYKRFDHFLAAKCPHISRSLLKKLFQNGSITSDVTLEIRKMPNPGTKICVKVPPPLPEKAVAENIPLDIIFEDDHFIVINKKAGMVTHPGAGNISGTLVNAILHHYPKMQEMTDAKRPGVAHRLDKGTSGLIIMAKYQKSLEELMLLFSSRQIEKYYHTLVMGTKINPVGSITTTIARHPTNRLKMAANVKDGKEAITHYQVLKTFEKMTYLQIKLETGRTHQIRVHMAQELRHAVLGDSLYGNPKQDLQRLGDPFKSLIGDYPYPFLHAQKIKFIHPFTKKEMEFEAEKPEIFLKVLELAQNGNL
ncbi:MAG: RNA pseudouridine synthase [Epsilonproteobacteria bacterium]|nr:MAG: RNA pseudouridine synthase [Campylobacterota bacterium]RLA66440.1 MAG: RNA pseudouridine synthase [Campylobacterota bacterium]